MKTNFKLIVAMVFIFFATNAVQAQQSEKQLKKEISAKAMKSARKEAKTYKKDGYYIAPGALLLDKQLENAWMKQYEVDDKDEPKYIVATGNSVAETQTAAKLQATETAKLELAGQISSQIAALIENSIANQQLNNEDAASITKTVAASKNLIAQELGKVIPLVELYKKIGTNVEANVRLAYNLDTAYEVAKKVIRKSLEEETEIAHEKLEKLMNFNK
ncbi:MAG: hypothetical protein RBR28_05575 [Lentimicrobium sp.]|jgi:lipopolysaccharide export LptBFGC system permease protein LptF|nr:hypothetical protein [Lentimicrobium sp.]